MSLKAFEIALNKFADEVVPEQLAVLQRAVTLQVLSGVVLRTPVDTGRARGNWQVSLEVPVLTALGKIDKTGGDTISAGSSAVAGLKPFSISYVQNNVSYIEYLEDGSSQQAPSGMVGLTVAEVGAQFK